MPNARPSSAAATFRPASMEAVRASQVFIAERDHWMMQMDQIKHEIMGLVRAHTGLCPSGILSKDPLGMSAYGLVFRNFPGVGFRLDESSADSEAAQGAVRCIPDVAHPIGQEVAALLHRFGQTAEMRPLLNTIQGVHSFGIEAGRLILTEAQVMQDGLVIAAAPSAVHDGQHLVRLYTDKSSVAQSSLAIRPKSRLN